GGRFFFYVIAANGRRSHHYFFSFSPYPLDPRSSLAAAGLLHSPAFSATRADDRRLPSLWGPRAREAEERHRRARLHTRRSRREARQLEGFPRQGGFSQFLGDLVRPLPRRDAHDGSAASRIQRPGARRDRGQFQRRQTIR